MAACCLSSSLFCCTATDRVTLLIGAISILHACKPVMCEQTVHCAGPQDPTAELFDGEGLVAVKGLSGGEGLVIAKGW